MSLHGFKQKQRKNLHRKILSKKSTNLLQVTNIKKINIKRDGRANVKHRNVLQM